MEQDHTICPEICKCGQSTCDKCVGTFSVHYEETVSHNTKLERIHEENDTLGHMDRGTNTDRQNVTTKRIQVVGDKSKCMQCNTIIQQVAGLLNEIRLLRSDEAKGRCVCELFSIRNISGKCKRCYASLERFLIDKAQLYDLRQQPYTEWLSKVKHILQSIFDSKTTTCHQKEHPRYGTSNQELEDLLNQLKSPLSSPEVQIGHFPSSETTGNLKISVEFEKRKKILDESTNILEHLLEKLKEENERTGKPKTESRSPRSISFTSLPPLTTRFKVLPPKAFKSSPSLPPTNEMIEMKFKEKAAKVLRATSISEKGGEESRYTSGREAVKLNQGKMRPQSQAKMQNLKQKQPVGMDSSMQRGGVTKKSPARSLNVINGDDEDSGKTIRSKKLMRRKDQSLKKTASTSPVLEKLRKYNKDLDLSGSDNLRDKKGQSTKKIKTVQEKSSGKEQSDDGIVSSKSRKGFEAKAITQKKELSKPEVKRLTKTGGLEGKNKSKAANKKRQHGTGVNTDDGLGEELGQEKPLKQGKIKKQLRKELKLAKEKEKKAETRLVLKKDRVSEKNTDDELERESRQIMELEYELSLEKALKESKIEESKKKKQLRKEMILAKKMKNKEDLLEKEKRQLFLMKDNVIANKLAMLTTKPKLQFGGEYEIHGSVVDRKACGHVMLGTEMIKGNKIVNRHPKHYKKETATREALFPRISHLFGSKELQIVPQKHQKEKPTQKNVGIGVPGRFLYELSNREFIDNGVTQLPEVTVTRRMNVFKMVPSSHGNWFENNKDSKVLYYDTDEILAEIDDEGFGKLYYKNGILALDYHKATELYAEQRYVIYSSGKSDDNGNPRPVTVLASFDRMGNGIVYDHYGNIRLKYSQSEGEVIDPNVGAPGRWKWHGLNDATPVSTKCKDTVLSTHDRDPRLDVIIEKSKISGKLSIAKKIDERLIQTELDNYAKAVSKLAQTKYRNFEIKMKAFKLNEQFSLHILTQQNIYLRFIDGPVSLKLNLGMQLKNNEILVTEPMLIHGVSTPYDLPLSRSKSMEDIKKTVAAAKKHNVKTWEDRFTRKARKNNIVINKGESNISFSAVPWTRIQ